MDDLEKIADGISGVYFLKNNDNGLIKIGCSKDINERIKCIKSMFNHVGVCSDLSLIGVIECIDYKKLEHHLHTVFKDNRVQCEWFDISEELLLKYSNALNLDKYSIQNDKEEVVEEIESIVDIANSICDNTSNKIGTYFWCLNRRSEEIREAISNDEQFVEFYNYIFKIINNENIKESSRPEIICYCFDTISTIIHSYSNNIYGFDWKNYLTKIIPFRQKTLDQRVENLKYYWEQTI